MRSLAIGCVALGGVLVAPACALGATTLGETFTPTGNCAAEQPVLIQTTSPPGGAVYAAPAPGVITSWSVMAPAATEQMAFKVARSAGGGNYTIVGESDAEQLTAAQLNTHPARIPVVAGDMIGVAPQNLCSRTTMGAAASYHNSNPSTGSTFPYTALPNVQLDVSASLEPDADGDGYGDETQDLCPSDPTSQCMGGGGSGGEAPETSILKSPKKKSAKSKAKLVFTSSIADSTFQCRLKGKGLSKKVKKFASCTSPKKYKHLKPGKYKFSVYATDPSGTADSTPEQRKFKVVRKH